jgi:signal peptidase I
MKQTRIETILMFSILILYYVLSQVLFVKMGSIYSMVINPLFWILLCVILKLYIKKTYAIAKLKKEIIDYTLITVLGYIIIYLISGLFVSFGKNPNSTTFKGLLVNFWVTGSVILTREYVRYLIINNTFQKQKKKVGIALIIIMTMLEVKTLNITDMNIYYAFKQVASILLPVLSKNILFTYLAYCKNYVAAVCYDLLIYLVLWLSPILPNMTWFMIAIIDIATPIILLLYIRYIKIKKDYFKSKESASDSEPKSVIILVIVVILAIWFALGIFPIKPIAIASGSMIPQINIGDIAIIKKCGPNDIKVGDIIEYKMPDFTVVHRVIEIKQENGKFYFVTKGDNNSSRDKNLVTEEQLIGKCIFKIKYLGYPAIWITDVKTQNELDL